MKCTSEDCIKLVLCMTQYPQMSSTTAAHTEVSGELTALFPGETERRDSPPDPHVSTVMSAAAACVSLFVCLCACVRAWVRLFDRQLCSVELRPTTARGPLEKAEPISGEATNCTHVHAPTNDAGAASVPLPPERKRAYTVTQHERAPVR